MTEDGEVGVAKSLLGVDEREPQLGRDRRERLLGDLLFDLRDFEHGETQLGLDAMTLASMRRRRFHDRDPEPGVNSGDARTKRSIAGISSRVQPEIPGPRGAGVRKGVVSRDVDRSKPAQGWSE